MPRPCPAPPAPEKFCDLLERPPHRIRKRAQPLHQVLCRLLLQRIHGRLCQAHRQFNRYIQEVSGREDLALQSPNVSFDTHAYLCHERLRSKLSDVLISDPARQVFLFIETKYLTNWTYAADVAKGLERLDKVFDVEKKPHLADARQHYFLLTSRRKEEAADRPVRHYTPVSTTSFVPTAPVAAEAIAGDGAEPAAKDSFTSLLYWEDLAQMCDRSEVRQYMEARLKLCISSNRNQHKAGYFLPGV